MVKAYFKYEYAQTVGQFCSSSSNFEYDAANKRFYSGVNQYIAIIDSKLGHIIKYLYKPNKNVPVRYVKLAANKVCAGYEDGEIIIWSTQTYQQMQSFNRHKSAISCIRLVDDDTVMISAGYDSRIIIWDLISEECNQINDAHKGTITQVETVTIYNQINCVYEDLILSSAKDGYFKVWNLKNRLQVEVVSSLTNEIWSFCYNPITNLVYVGTNREQVIIIKLAVVKDPETRLNKYCEVVARFKRNNYSRPLQLILNSQTMYLLNSDKNIQIYHILDDKELNKRKKRLISRKKGKQVEQDQIQEQNNNQLLLDRNQEQIRIKLQKQKPLLQKAFNMVIHKNQIYINNGSNIYDVTNDLLITNSLGLSQNLNLSHPHITHQHDQELKLFETTNMSLLFTLPINVVSSSIYKGYLLILAQSSIIVWKISTNQQVLRKQGDWKRIYSSDYGIITWKDGVLAFYSFGLTKKNILQLNKESEKFYNENITQASYISSEKYAVCTQDSNVHIVHADTHKPFLKLYGHKLPILSYDSSSDYSLLLTGSVDKDIKLWDLDFGNCVKSIFAHDQAVTIVKFVKDTHYFFSGSKDGHIKFWDGDKYQLILDLEQSITAIRHICVSNSGDYMLATSNDGGVRIWKQSTEQVFYSEQQEKRVEKMMIEDYATKKLEENQEKTTYTDLKHGQQIIECLLNNSQPRELLQLLKKISPTKLKSSLSFLHSHHIQKLVMYLKYFMHKGIEYELIWRIFEAINLQQNLADKLREQWKKDKSIVMVNIEAIKLVERTIKENQALLDF